MSWLDAPIGKRWLDVGCGTGALTSQILKGFDPKLGDGVEPSEGLLEQACRNIKNARVIFRQGAEDSIPVKDATVDNAVSGLVPNFIPDINKALAELARIVGLGCTVAAYDWDYAGHVEFMRTFWNAAIALDPVAVENDEGARFSICRPAALSQLFSEVVFHGARVDPVEIPCPFRNFDTYRLPFLSGIAPAPGYCASLHEEARGRLKKQLAESLLTDSDGKILLAAQS